VCIIGAGNLSSRKIYPYVGLAGAELVGACDLDAEKAQRNARRFGGRPYTDLDRMLDAEKPDGVIICIGPAAHAELARHVMRRGYAVYTEKPPAASAAEALATARVAKETGKLCVTAFKKRYATAYDRARAWIDGFDASDRLSLSADYASNAFNGDASHRRFLLDFCIHLIDLVGYLFGEARRVFCFARADRAYAVSLEFACGAVGAMNLNDGRGFGLPTEEVEITLAGGNWMTIHNSSTYRIVEDGKASEWREPPLFISAGDSGNETGHGVELKHFVRALAGGPVPRSHISQSYHSMVLFEAIKESADTGRVVDVAYEEI
jgi:predicted dehydrogenase